MSVKIVYRDVDFQTKKDLSSISVQSNTQGEYMDSELFNYVAVPSQRQATLEKNFWRLDGSYDLPDVENKMNIALFSKPISKKVETEYGYELSESVSLSFTFDVNVNISSLTFTFDSPDFCTHLLVEGFSNEEQSTNVFSEDVYPDNEFYTYEFGETYNVISIKFTFYAMNKPNRFLKIYGIDFGKAYSFADDEVYDISILKETSLIGDSLPIGTSEITLDTKHSEVTEFNKMKPVFIYKNNKLERTHYITDSEEIGYYQKILYCSDSLWLLDTINDTIINEFIPQEIKITETRNLVTKYGDTLGYAVNYPDYISPYINNYVLMDFIKKLKEILPFKIVIDSDISDLTIFYKYNTTALKDLLNEIIFANLLDVKIHDNGNLQVAKRKNKNVKFIEQQRIYSNFTKRTTDKINVINYSVYSTTETNMFEDIQGAKAVISANEGGYATLGASITNSTQLRTCTFQQLLPNEFSVEYDVITGGGPYHHIYWTKTSLNKTEKQINLEEINANVKKNEMSINDNKFINLDNENEFVNAVSEYYKHNSTLEFDMILEDEREGDWIEVDLLNKKYTGRIQKIEYTMQGKKIGTVTMRIYNEVNVIG